MGCPTLALVAEDRLRPVRAEIETIGPPIRRRANSSGRWYKAYLTLDHHRVFAFTFR
jgi:hypothetical protein